MRRRETSRVTIPDVTETMIVAPKRIDWLDRQ